MTLRITEPLADAMARQCVSRLQSHTFGESTLWSMPEGHELRPKAFSKFATDRLHYALKMALLGMGSFDVVRKGERRVG